SSSCASLRAGRAGKLCAGNSCHEPPGVEALLRGSVFACGLSGCRRVKAFSTGSPPSACAPIHSTKPLMPHLPLLHPDPLRRPHHDPRNHSDPFPSAVLAAVARFLVFSRPAEAQPSHVRKPRNRFGLHPPDAATIHHNV